MRKPTYPLALALAASTVASAPAMAQDLPQTDVSVNVKATPSKAGTKRNPRGIALTATARVKTEAGFERPIVTGVDTLLGKGIDYHGDDYVKCSKRTLDREGPERCPRKSVMGSATATAMADTIVTHPDVVFLNAGSKLLYAYTTLYRPALVQETIVIKSRKLTGKWGHGDTFRVPENLQVVAGVPIQVTAMRFTLGGKPYAQDYMATTSCPKGGWKYQATVHYLHALGQTDQDVVSGSMPCTK